MPGHPLSHRNGKNPPLFRFLAASDSPIPPQAGRKKGSLGKLEEGLDYPLKPPIPRLSRRGGARPGEKDWVWLQRGAPLRLHGHSLASIRVRRKAYMCLRSWFRCSYVCCVGPRRRERRSGEGKGRVTRFLYIRGASITPDHVYSISPEASRLSYFKYSIPIKSSYINPESFNMDSGAPQNKQSQPRRRVRLLPSLTSSCEPRR